MTEKKQEIQINDGTKLSDSELDDLINSIDFVIIVHTDSDENLYKAIEEQISKRYNVIYCNKYLDKEDNLYYVGVKYKKETGGSYI
jgi:hypothetical protein